MENVCMVFFFSTIATEFDSYSMEKKIIISAYWLK